MKLHYQHYTDAGDQCINQDYCVHRITDNNAFFMTADGLGGHQAGEKIARALCETMLAFSAGFVTELQTQDAKAALLNWFNQAMQKMALDYAHDGALQKAHSTFALLWLDHSTTLTAHIGDTRIYCIREGQVSRSRDHSVPQMLLDEGEISEQEMAHHPDQNRLTRSVCLANRHLPTIKILPIADKNTHFVLCSDGFWINTTQQELVQLTQSVMTQKSLKTLAKAVIERANAQSDNVTVQWVQVE